MNDQQPIEDILHNAKPKADSTFQHNLEEQLIARLHEKYDTNEDNPTMTKMKRKHRVSRLPFTLAAAIIAIVLVGGLVILLNRSSTSTPMAINHYTEPPPDAFQLTATQLIVTATEGMSLQLGTPAMTPDIYHLTATALIQSVTQTQQAQQSGLLPTLTPVPMNPNDDTGIPVMVAARDIGIGETITEDMVHRVYWSRGIANAAIEANPANGGLFGNWEDVIGQQAQAFIPQWHPIQAELIGSQAADGILDEGMAFISGSINQIMPSSPVNVGEVFDIFVYYPEPQPPVVSAEVGSIVYIGGASCNFAINNAELFFIGKVEEAPDYLPRPTADTSPTNLMVTIIVRGEDAMYIQEALDSGAQAGLQSSSTIR
jgi:hypothetical protein